jgi:hypothetical protein
VRVRFIPDDVFLAMLGLLTMTKRHHAADNIEATLQELFLRQVVRERAQKLLETGTLGEPVLNDWCHVLRL